MVPTVNEKKSISVANDIEEAEDNECVKHFSKHKKLCAGLVSIFCPHGRYVLSVCLERPFGYCVLCIGVYDKEVILIISKYLIKSIGILLVGSQRICTFFVRIHGIAFSPSETNCYI